MTTDDKEPNPDVLEHRPGSQPFKFTVINLADVRMRHGIPVRTARQCLHHSLVFNQEQRRVWCEECEKTLDNFDAFMVCVLNYTAMVKAAEHDQEKAAEALAATLVRRAAKAMDRSWGKGWAIRCVHCGGGLLPEDYGEYCFAPYGSREEELKRRETIKTLRPRA